MDKKHIISCIAIVFVSLSVVIYMWYRRERYEYNQQVIWFDQAMDEFFHRFNRPVDPVHLRYYTLKTENMPATKAIKFIKDDLTAYQKEIREGEKIAHDSSLIITGLLRNSAFHIPSLKRRCKEMTSGFRDYRIIIVENNSIDGSREYLLEWTIEDPNVVILCRDAFSVNNEECDISNMFTVSQDADHSPRPDRIYRMAFLRNIYMDHIRHYYPSFDFMCVMDMDLHGDLYMDGWMHAVRSLANKGRDAIACNGMIMRNDSNFYYYDSFAHVEENEPIVWEDATSKSNHDRTVHLHVTHRYSSLMKHDRVRSAFGGAVLYRLSRIRNHAYGSSPDHYSCEHSYFHRGIDIYVDPRFIFMIEKNGV